ncbi:MAG: helix-turn-helix transcriptional regulator [Lachnospiraceae bacterium]|nr:helix-turn-helix transcriptional regulator [Lachnospiraceae bacterium]
MFEMDKEQFGKFVLELRKEKGLTQKELADRLYVSDKTVSKWECGKGMPDISMLVPLGELLGVSVTELLECKRHQPDALLNVEQVESVVQKVLHVSEEEVKMRYLRKKNRMIFYVVALAIAGLEIGFAYNLKWKMDTFWMCGLTFVLLAAVFGAWFTFGAKEKLPAYYDEYKVDSFSDGFFRMNIPGVHFNNRNWPHMIKAGWIWSVAVLTACPVACFLFDALVANGILLFLGIGMPIFIISLFVPFYVAGVKYK